MHDRTFLVTDLELSMRPVILPPINLTSLAHTPLEPDTANAPTLILLLTLAIIIPPRVVPVTLPVSSPWLVPSLSIAPLRTTGRLQAREKPIQPVIANPPVSTKGAAVEKSFKLLEPISIQ